MGDRFEYRSVRVDGDHGPIVSGFSARVPAEGLTAVVGPSGAGKTTLVRLLSRLDDADAGTVLFDGRDVRTYDVLELRRRVQHVAQLPVAFPGTVADNVVAGVNGGHRRISPAGPAGEHLVASLLDRVGLAPQLAMRDADRLSVGEAQRLCLARALAVDPDALVLDEPTSALDPASRAGVEALIRALADDGLTVVIVTHDRRQAGELADRTVEVPG